MAACLLLPACAHGQAGVEELDRPDGQRIAGRIEGDARSGFRFAPRGGGPPIALEPGAIVRREGQGQGPGPGSRPAAPAGLPPFHLLVGEAARLSGTLRTLTGSEVRFAPAWQPGEVTMPRACLQAIVQRPGEARVLADGFEAIDAARWSVAGIAATADRTRPGAGRVLRLTAQGTSSLTHNLEEPLAAGRLELAFHDDGKVARGHECVVETMFRRPSGPAAIRIILGWSEDSPAVESPGVTSLQVQRLVRTPGWHRLTLRFGPEETEIAVNGQELAHGRGPDGPLTAITLSARTLAAAASATATDRPLSAEFDDLLLIRFVEPPASVEIDPTQDEARLVVGDQLFGEVRAPTPTGWTWRSTAGRSRCGGARSPGCTSAACRPRGYPSRACWCAPSGAPRRATDRPTSISPRGPSWPSPRIPSPWPRPIPARSSSPARPEPAGRGRPRPAGRGRRRRAPPGR